MAHRFGSDKSKSLMTFARQWILMDAQGQELEGFGHQICKLLEGRHKPIYHHTQDVGDHVVVINTRDLVVPEKKIYWWNTEYAQGFRHVYAKDFHVLRPTECLRLQVKLHLMKQTLSDQKFKRRRLNRLFLFPGPSYVLSNAISQVWEPPSPVFKKLQHYSCEEVDSFPKAPEDLKKPPQLLYDIDRLEERNSRKIRSKSKRNKPRCRPEPLD